MDLKKWIDEYIKWDAKKYGNVSKLRFTIDEIWKPGKSFHIVLDRSLTSNSLIDLEIWNTGVDIFSKDQYASDSEIIAFSNGK